MSEVSPWVSRGEWQNLEGSGSWLIHCASFVFLLLFLEWAKFDWSHCICMGRVPWTVGLIRTPLGNLLSSHRRAGLVFMNQARALWIGNWVLHFQGWIKWLTKGDQQKDCTHVYKHSCIALCALKDKEEESSRRKQMERENGQLLTGHFHGILEPRWEGNRWCLPPCS